VLQQGLPSGAREFVVFLFLYFVEDDL